MMAAISRKISYTDPTDPDIIETGRELLTSLREIEPFASGVIHPRCLPRPWDSMLEEAIDLYERLHHLICLSFDEDADRARQYPAHEPPTRTRRLLRMLDAIHAKPPVRGRNGILVRMLDAAKRAGGSLKATEEEGLCEPLPLDGEAIDELEAAINELAEELPPPAKLPPESRQGREASPVPDEVHEEGSAERITIADFEQIATLMEEDHLYREAKLIRAMAGRTRVRTSSLKHIVFGGKKRTPNAFDQIVRGVKLWLTRNRAPFELFRPRGYVCLREIRVDAIPASDPAYGAA